VLQRTAGRVGESAKTLAPSPVALAYIKLGAGHRFFFSFSLSCSSPANLNPPAKFVVVVSPLPAPSFRQVRLVLVQLADLLGPFNFPGIDRAQLFSSPVCKAPLRPLHRD
jgi:hypothetical protein